MELTYGNLTYGSIEKFNKYSISMKKINAELQQAKDTQNLILEQHIERKIGIIESIREIQAKFGLKILNYYCQSCADYSFIEETDGTKYILKKYDGKLIKDSNWKA